MVHYIHSGPLSTQPPTHCVPLMVLSNSFAIFKKKQDYQSTEFVLKLICKNKFNNFDVYKNICNEQNDFRKTNALTWQCTTFYTQ